MKQFILGLMILCAPGALYTQEGAETRAVIRELSGTVELKAPGAADWTPAVRGQTLTRSTLISTGFKSGALIVIGDSTLSVQALTRLSLEELARTGKSEKVDLNLRTGRIRANVKPPSGGNTEFTVRSPAATASVRGTVFEFNGTILQVQEGRVHLAGNGGNGTYVGAGHRGRMETESGHTAGPAETAAEELAPAVPAGVDGAGAAPAALPSGGDIDAGFTWN
jgi:hypothetical protein